MCGIVGAVGDFSADQGLEIVTRMNKTIVHRGPDDAGTFAADKLALGMRRLSIIDLAGGHQPMWQGEPGDGPGLVFNGEIYNYKSLRADLEKRGVTFRTQSDTEVLLHLLALEGLDGLGKLEGMFAIAFYDPKNGQLHLIRDRLGIKPLYYGAMGDRQFFASEIKAIIAGMEQKPAINQEAINHYLTLRFVPGPETIWQGIWKLPPGHVLSIDLATGTRRMRPFWHVQFKAEAMDTNRDYLAEFEKLFLAAVGKRLEAADVPVGVMLSGGLDSSAVAAAAVELGHRDFHTFSVAFNDGGEFDERKYARDVAHHIGARHHEVVIDQQQFLDFLPRLVDHSDEPLADLAAVPLYYVSELARKDVKVVLSGEGADEVLCGYDMEHLAASLQRLARIDKLAPRFVKKLAARIAPRRLGVLGTLADHGWQNLLSARGTHMTRHFSAREKTGLWRTGGAGMADTDALIRQWYGLADSDHPIDQLQQVYCHSWLVEDLLMKADKMSMAASLELRVPFLDHDLVEWAATLPLAHKVGGAGGAWVSKRILRQYAAKRLPKAILERPKQGFPVPAYAWLRGPLGETVSRRLFDEPSTLAGYLDLSAAKPVMAAARGGDGAAAHKVWALLILQQWMERWL